MAHRAILLVGSLLVVAAAQGQTSFVNWETPHVHPLDITPDGSKLLAVNTADNRLEVFDISRGSPSHLVSIPVGLDPVSVRARTNGEAWVVNHISDSVSVVSLTTMNTRATIATGDEPADVVFAGSPQRAFVSVSQRNQVRVFDPLNLAAPAIIVNIAGEDPRALATDGTRVYAAIFESGNATTILSKEIVDQIDGPYAGVNPPPNSGASFFPPLTPGLPTPPRAGMIVHRENGAWVDDNGHDWSSKVTWNLHDHDVAVIDAASLAVTYVSGLMNINMQLAIEPGGAVTVVGTDAINQVRFEPNLTGIFGRIHMARFVPGSTAAPEIVDLNPHLTYASPSVAQAQRDQSIGDPRGMTWTGDGSRAYVTGMGSNNVIVIGPDGSRLGLVEVGAGPTGIVMNPTQTRLYVLNKFDATISVIDAAANTELMRAPLFDPTPQVIHDGRPFLYDTHATSGLGQVSCASCHVDARMDQIGWNLGNPAGTMTAVNPALCSPVLPPPPFAGIPCAPFHPMKGPMATQTLVGIINSGPMHWRGDRANLAAFDVAFTGLQGDDAPPTPAQMTAFTNFIATIRFPPQPNRTIQNQLPASVPGFTGNPIAGQGLFAQPGLVGNIRPCTICHIIPTGGTNGRLMPGLFLGEVQTFKVPHLRNLYEKSGFSTASQSSNMGFGILHDGSDDTLFNFLQNPIFTFPAGQIGINQRRDIEAFLMCFPTDTHAAVGTQVTADGINNDSVALVNLLNTMAGIANTAAAKMVAKGIVAGEARGYSYIGNNTFQSDRAAQAISLVALRQSAIVGGEITFTMVPTGTQTRIGIDRDEDGFFDRDELDAGSDPADPDSVPGGSCPADLNGDGIVNSLDLGILLSSWSIPAAAPGCSGALPCAADLDGNGVVNSLDLGVLLSSWTVGVPAPGCP